MRSTLRIFFLAALGLSANCWANNIILHARASSLSGGASVEVSVYENGQVRKVSVTDEGDYRSYSSALRPSVVATLKKNLRDVQDLRLFRATVGVTCAAVPTTLSEYEGYVNHSERGMEIVKIEETLSPCGTWDSIDHDAAKNLVENLSMLLN